MDTNSLNAITSFFTPILSNALPTIGLILGLIIVPALGIAGLKMAYRKGKGLIDDSPPSKIPPWPGTTDDERGDIIKYKSRSKIPPWD